MKTTSKSTSKQPHTRTIEHKNSLKNKDIYTQIVSYLNEKIKASFRDNTPGTIKLMEARLKEGYTLEDFKKVIDNQYDAWWKDEKYRKYLRPSTLFGDKFDEYLQNKPMSWQEKTRMAT